jgi:hypothetical protein
VKIRKIREDFEATTKTVSDLVRQLAFAGIAVIWVIRVGDDAGGIRQSLEPLFPSLLLFVVALAFDFAQYVFRALTLFFANIFFWTKYRNEEQDVLYSGWLNLLPYLFFFGKAVCLIVAYWQLLLFIYAQLNPGKGITAH